MNNIKNKTAGLLVLFQLVMGATLNAQTAEDQWLTDYEASLKLANTKNIPILINFSGSDWCKPCVLLSETIFDTDAFRNFSKDSLVLLNLDFPVKKANQPPEQQMKKREELAEIYNSSGIFPAVVLIDGNENIIGRTGYKKLSPEEYILHLKSLLVNFSYPTVESYENSIECREEHTMMGARFELVALDNDPDLARQAVKSARMEIERIESLISSWDEHSQTHMINENAGIQPVKVDEELFALIERCIKVSTLTGGAFDISFASIDKIWKFDRTMASLPDSASVSSSVEKINYENIVLDREKQTVYLKEKGMKIGFGAIGKGYAANRAKKKMKDLGVENGIVNAGGDISAWGPGKTEQGWRIGIADPTKKKNFVSYIRIEDMAVVTSGDYERYSMINGERYSHIIDPKTGYPAKGLISVTVLCPDAELADALATAVFVLGEKKGLNLINRMALIDCVLINDSGHILTSDNLNLNFTDNN